MRAIAVSLLAVLAISCGKHIPDDNSSWNVTFHNMSKYSVSVYQNSPSSGAILVDKLASGDSYSLMVPTDDYGFGSVFSIKYWFEVDDNVWATGLDRGTPLQYYIEAGKKHDIQIPNSSNIEWEDAFIKIRNTSSNSIEFCQRSNCWSQANGEFPVPPRGNPGVYRVSGKIEGRAVKYTDLVDSYPLPDFIAENGYIYNFTFDGNSVEEGRRQKI
jgi:hypothetical protein